MVKKIGLAALALSLVQFAAHAGLDEKKDSEKKTEDSAIVTSDDGESKSEALKKKKDKAEETKEENKDESKEENKYSDPAAEETVKQEEKSKADA
jgi:hypothetical protein